MAPRPVHTGETALGEGPAFIRHKEAEAHGWTSRNTTTDRDSTAVGEPAQQHRQQIDPRLLVPVPQVENGDGLQPSDVTVQTKAKPTQAQAATPAPEGHRACNPSYSGGSHQEDRNLRPARAKVSVNPSQQASQVQWLTLITPATWGPRRDSSSH
jgi:hypothetical protein